MAVLDIGMPGLNGLEVARRVSQVSSRTRVIILSMYADSSYVRQALKAGVAGYLLKGAAVSELSLALKAVMDGEKYLALVRVYGLPRERTLKDRGMEIFIILQFGVLSDRINEVCLIS